MELYDWSDRGQEWRAELRLGKRPPAQVNHGSLGVCVDGGRVLLVSRHDGEWEFPAGRPEPDETPLETLLREVWEEACCHVVDATYVGTAVATCLSGAEQGKVLSRTLWRCDVKQEGWVPQHETTSRTWIDMNHVVEQLAPPPGLFPFWRRLLAAATAASGEN